MHLEKIRKRANLTQGELADLAGVKQATISRIERGSDSVTLRALTDIATALDISVGDLFESSATRPKADFPSIPRYDIQLSAGAGVVNYEDAEILDNIPFTEEFLTQKLGRRSTEGLICCYISGESMAPTLEEGDLVIVDTQMISETPAGIYAVNFGDESFVKRVEKINSGYNLFSDNPAYGPIRVRGNEVNLFHFIGKIVWSGGVY